jgi:iron complex transport system substrate-binding protein
LHPDWGPQRIVCLTEETTEWLYLLGQEQRIVGISGYTVRPPRARQEKPRISSFLDGKIDRIVPIDLPCQMEGFGIITRRDRLLSPAGEVMLRAIRATAQTLYGLVGAVGVAGGDRLGPAT